MEILITAANVKKVFNRRIVFQDISVSLVSGQTLLITGRNGSGKSTLAKIISGILTPSSGSVTAHQGSRDVTNYLRNFVGFVAPYVQMYDEFSARENLRFALAIRGLPANEQIVDLLLSKVSLEERADDRVATFSSGMKQRLKYAFALVHNPIILILDEPMANLDSEGIHMVREVIREHRREGILVVATNDLHDIDRHDLQVDLNAVHE